MRSPKAAKPATARHGEPASEKTKQLGSPLDVFSTRKIKDLQVQKLVRRCSISIATAAVVASLFYGEARL